MVKSIDQRKAWELLTQQTHLVLATQSRRQPRFPYTSWVPFQAHRAGAVIILVADIAEHTLNLLTNEHTSLFLAETPESSPAAAGMPVSVVRLSLFARAQRLELPEAEAVCQGFYTRHPALQDYHRRLGFVFFEMTLVEGRFIGGPGRARWIGAADFAASFSAATESAPAPQ